MCRQLYFNNQYIMFNNSETKYESSEDGEVSEYPSLLMQLTPPPLIRLKGQDNVVRRYLCCIYTCYYKLEVEIVISSNCSSYCRGSLSLNLALYSVRITGQNVNGR